MRVLLSLMLLTFTACGASPAAPTMRHKSGGEVPFGRTEDGTGINLSLGSLLGGAALGLLVVGGVVWWLLDDDEPPPKDDPVRPTPLRPTYDDMDLDEIFDRKPGTP